MVSWKREKIVYDFRGPLLLYISNLPEYLANSVTLTEMKNKTLRRIISLWRALSLHVYHQFFRSHMKATVIRSLDLTD